MKSKMHAWKGGGGKLRTSRGISFSRREISEFPWSGTTKSALPHSHRMSISIFLHSNSHVSRLHEFHFQAQLLLTFRVEKCVKSRDGWCVRWCPHECCSVLCCARRELDSPHLTFNVFPLYAHNDVWLTHNLAWQLRGGERKNSWGKSVKKEDDWNVLFRDA